MLQKPVSVKCQAKGNCVTDCLWHSLFLMLKGFQYSLSQAHTVTDYNNCNFYQQIYIWGNTESKFKQSTAPTGLQFRKNSYNCSFKSNSLQLLSQIYNFLFVYEVK